MKTLGYLIGALAGFWLADVALDQRAPVVEEKKALAASRPSASEKAETTAATSAARDTHAIAMTLPAPARNAPEAFSFLLVTLPNSLPSDYAANSASREAYDRALLARAKDRIAPLVLAVGLNDTQYQALLELAVDHTRKWQELSRQPGNSRKREEYSAEFSRTAEARLAALLTPDQLEQVARLNRSSIAFAAMVDAFAAHGAPLAREHAPRLLAPGTARTTEGSFTVLNPTEPDPSAPWMTNAQRRYATARQRWLAAGELIDAVNSTKVKGP
jgi:hypothetical protein